MPHRSGRMGDAGTLLVESFRLLSGKHGREDEQVQQLAERLGRFYEEQGRVDESATYRALPATGGG